MTLQTLTLYILGAMNTWTPPKVLVQTKRDPTEEKVRARYESIATDISKVALDPDEEPRYKGANARTKQALLYAALAGLESRYRGDVDEGRCPKMECDAGYAWTLWQLHPEGGVVLDGTGYAFARNKPRAWLLEHASSVLHGPDLILNRILALKVVARFLRAHGVAPWTTGPQARSMVEAYVQAHPPPAE